MKAGIDPYLGILHVDRHNRPTMVYDFIEPFRHWADRVALDLVFNDRLPADAFWENPPFLAKKAEEGIAKDETTEGTGFWLAASGKPIVVTAFAQFMDDKIEYRKQQQRRQTVLDMEAQSLAAILKKLV
jgi:CRISP-associated protein Cas1